VRAWLLFAALGVAAGLTGAFYNTVLLWTLSAADRLTRWPTEIRAAAIGAAVGALGWFVPDLIGGGDNVTQRVLAGGGSLVFLPLAFLLRFGLGALSYASATPGGLFAPILVLGAQLGLLAGTICGVAFSDMRPEPVAFAIVGMAAFFTGVVQAPVTGIVLVIEMTASFPTLLPMIAACFAAMVVPNLLGCAPIYDSLRSRVFREQERTAARL
jgi:CIC family chloride channel protein